VSPARKRLFVVLGCAAVGLFAAMSIAPRGGARWVSGWTGDFLGSSGLTLGAIGAGLGLLVGLLLTASESSRPPTGPASGNPDATPPKRRRWKAPKRFGRRGG
jgi:hypothetical protein